MSNQAISWGSCGCRRGVVFPPPFVIDDDGFGESATGGDLVYEAFFDVGTLRNAGDLANNGHCTIGEPILRGAIIEGVRSSGLLVSDQHPPIILNPTAPLIALGFGKNDNFSEYRYKIRTFSTRASSMPDNRVGVRIFDGNPNLAMYVGFGYEFLRNDDGSGIYTPKTATKDFTLSAYSPVQVHLRLLDNYYPLAGYVAIRVLAVHV